MNFVDVAVIGGGSAGSLAAAILGRAGISTMMVDLHETYPPEFRCEKIHDDQAAILKKTGLADTVLPVATPITEMWVARRGRMIARLRLKGRPYEYGVAYEDLVNGIRRQIPDPVKVVYGRANKLTTSEDRQTIVLSNGEEYSARLVVMATGMNNGLVSDKVNRSEISKSHSISAGFDVVCKTGFKFPALTYFAECTGPMAYITIFPIGERMRANLFVYHDLRDDWVRKMRLDPLAATLELMPRLRRYIEGVEVTGEIRVRPMNLYMANDYLHPGFVLIGDSFGTSCPSAGTGLNKVFTDVERLCNQHIPAWLNSPGMGIDKLTKFYNDPAKTACDDWSLFEAFYQRSLAIDTTIHWNIRRTLWFGIQWMQGMRSRLFARQNNTLHQLSAVTRELV